MKHQSGFSLIEVLVAVTVFATVSAISVAMLSGALRAKSQSEAALEQLAAVQRVSALLRDDIGQLVLRPARQSEGLFEPRVFAASSEGTEAVRARAGGARQILVLTRTGWSNPGALQPRSTLQRVSWVLDDGGLYREVLAYPDAATASEPRRQLLIDNIDEVELDLIRSGSWFNTVLIGTDGENAVALPDAVRLRYRLAGMGVMEHVALSPAAEAR